MRKRENMETNEGIDTGKRRNCFNWKEVGGKKEEAEQGRGPEREEAVVTGPHQG